MSKPVLVQSHKRSSPKRSLTKRAMDELLKIDAAMNEAAREILSWTDRDFSLDTAGIRGEQSERMKETY